jgi:hypothetical protein
MRMRVCTLVGVCRWPYPLPYIYTPAQTFSKGFGVSTSLPHRPLKPQILKKAHRPLKRVPRRWGIYICTSGGTNIIIRVYFNSVNEILPKIDKKST